MEARYANFINTDVGKAFNSTTISPKAKLISIISKLYKENKLNNDQRSVLKNLAFQDDSCIMGAYTAYEVESDLDELVDSLIKLCNKILRDGKSASFDEYHLPVSHSIHDDQWVADKFKLSQKGFEEMPHYIDGATPPTPFIPKVKESPPIFKTAVPFTNFGPITSFIPPTGFNSNLPSGFEITKPKQKCFELEITIRSAGKHIPIKVSNLSTLVHSLKSSIQDSQPSFLIEKQRLFFYGKELENNRTLQEYNIINGSIIELALRV